MKKIFISHSSIDSQFVGELIDLIESVGIKSSQIFCSSFEEYGFDLGENFLERLKKELNDDEIIAFFILTQNFYRSPISLCEMGAIWIKSNKHIPILIPPFDFKDINGVFPVTQGMKINDKSKLNTLKESLESDFSLGSIKMSIWEKKRDKFLKDVNSLIEGKSSSFNTKTIADEITTEIKKENATEKITQVNSILSMELQDYMIEIPSGDFLMGDEKQGQKIITISKSFLMAKYPVKQSLYEYIMKSNPSHFKGSDLPVEKVSWFDAIEFCNQLSKNCDLEQVYEISDGRDKTVKINYEKNGYRLPTEAEWEYACRGNKTGDTYDNLDDIAWFSKDPSKQTHPVGQKKANNFGLFDMLGNVWEWCNDWFESNKLTIPQVDPIGPQTGFERVIRGGSWSDTFTNVKAHYRYRENAYSKDNNRGFRIVLANHK
jgi:formylglycine-generating enzyme required for sulfatase activity